MKPISDKMGYVINLRKINNKIRGFLSLRKIINKALKSFYKEFSYNLKCNYKPKDLSIKVIKLHGEEEIKKITIELKF